MNDRKIELPNGVPPLSMYYVYLTSGCNLACRHCWLTPTFQAQGSTGGHLDYNLFALAIEEGLPLGLRGVKLTGGEPLIHPDFTRIVDRVYENKLNMTMETNGVLMTDSLARFLKEKSPSPFISVSLDGASASTHDPFRGVKGCFDKAVQGIRSLVAVGIRPQVIMSLHEENVEDIEPLVALAEKLGAGSVKFNLIQPSGRGEMMKERNQTLGIQRLIKLGKWIETDLQKRTKLVLHYSWPMAFYGINRLLRKGSSGTCGIHGILGILPMGQLAMCGIGIEIPELSYGRLGVDRVIDVWKNNSMLDSLRREVPANLEGVCATCIFKKQCLGSCIAENYHQSHRLTSAFWFCQQANELGLFPLTRIQNSIDKINNRVYI
jgi:SynChlorMet cassette radical SAM/SPASM protein ScmF